jgi:hypothetical protein
MKKLLLLLPLIIAGICFGAGKELPPPPPGFSWQPLTSIQGFLLKPDGWFFKHITKGETDNYFITKEDIDKNGVFTTGLSFYSIRHVQKKTGLAPSSYAASLADAAAAKFHLAERSSSDQGKFKAIRIHYVDAPPDKSSITVSQLFIANDKTGTLFIAIFESPTTEWGEAWKKGQVILKQMMIDDEI